MLALVILALLLPIGTSAPSGIGTSADDGCLCHGEKNSDTSILVTGLPEFFESNTTYNFSVEVTSENIPMESGKPACVNVKAKPVLSPRVSAVASKREKSSIE